MNRFVQLHILTSYPPSNLNRDDLGRPKTAMMGGVNRLRVSSQSLKRAWRTSDVFKERLEGNLGTRTKMMGVEVYHSLIDKGVSEKKAIAWAGSIANVFGKQKSAKKDSPLTVLEIEQLAHFSPEEKDAIDNLVDKLAERNAEPATDELKLLKAKHTAADIAMFGRMLADDPLYNTEAAVQVAHPITTHRAAVENDFFTAVDDLNKGEDNVGAGHMGETEFGAGLFYLYTCINRELLAENLSGDDDLARRTIAALVDAAATVAPTGKQNSFGSRAYASYILAEKGSQQPRSLSVAFLAPVGDRTGGNYLVESIETLEKTREQLDKAYGGCAEAMKAMNTTDGTGTLDDIIAFCTSE